MADFWGGFGKGFAPAFEKAWESADRRREKREAEVKRLEEAKLDRLRKKIKERADQAATVAAYGGMGVEGMIPERRGMGVEGMIPVEDAISGLSDAELLTRSKLGPKLHTEMIAEKERTRKRMEGKAEKFLEGVEIEGRQSYLDPDVLAPTVTDELKDWVTDADINRRFGIGKQNIAEAGILGKHEAEITKDAVYEKWHPRVSRALADISQFDIGTDEFESDLEREMEELDTDEDAKNYIADLEETKGLMAILAVHQRTSEEDEKINAPELTEASRNLPALREMIKGLKLSPETQNAAQKNARISFDLARDLSKLHKEGVAKDNPKLIKAQAAMDMHTALTHSGYTINYKLNDKGESEFSLRQTGVKKDPVKLIIQDMVGGKLAAFALINPILRLDKTPEGLRILAEAERVKAEVQKALASQKGSSFFILSAAPPVEGDPDPAEDPPKPVVPEPIPEPMPEPMVDKSKEPTRAESIKTLSLLNDRERARAAKIMARLETEGKITRQEKLWFYKEKRLGGLLDAK